jgi:hypothetical protein
VDTSVVESVPVLGLRGRLLLLLMRRREYVSGFMLSDNEVAGLVREKGVGGARNMVIAEVSPFARARFVDRNR